jgi:phosphatidylinositol alpha 1,6-mannosyltransferase
VTIPRVAFFTDSFHEVNGVARTSREFVGYAGNQGYPLLSVHAGPATENWTEGSIETYEIKTSRLCVPLEVDLSFDVLFARHRARLLKALRRFRPDLVHVTGPGHCGLLGAILAHQLRVPLAASWHTNVHEFASRRLERLLPPLPARVSRPVSQFAESKSLAIILQFYRLARLLFAPNPEIIDMLSNATGRPTFPMVRGVDTGLFSPIHRDRTDDQFVIGYVGGLSSEKNVRLLVSVESELIAAGIRNYKFLVVGEGREREFLSTHLQSREFTGVLQGRELARAYANMDVFLFPSETDTFGNVILEALASGVPALVRSGGGPKYIVRSDVDGYEAEDVKAFATRILALCGDRKRRDHMSRNERAGASAFSWDAVFTGMYQRYVGNFEASTVLSPAKSSVVRPRSPIETLS